MEFYRTTDAVRCRCHPHGNPVPGGVESHLGASGATNGAMTLKAGMDAPTTSPSTLITVSAQLTHSFADCRLY